MRRSLSRHEDGSAAVEAVVLVPVLMAFVLLAVAFGRYETARTDLIGLAREGAEVASVMPSSTQASSAAAIVGSSGLSGVEGVCQNVEIGTDLDEFVPGGKVEVTVSCRVDLADFGAPGLGGVKEISVHQVAPIDPYRVVRP